MKEILTIRSKAYWETKESAGVKYLHREFLFPINTFDPESEIMKLGKSQGIFVTTPNSARAVHPKRKPTDENGNILKTYTYMNYKTSKLVTYDTEVGGDKDMIMISTVNQVYAAGSSKNGTCTFAPEEYEIEIVGEEIVQTNNVAMPEWRVSRKIYFKYFWLFYIVAKDYWDKYPDDIHIESWHKDFQFSESEKKGLLEKEKPIFEEALRLAKQNYPEFALAEEMVEEKKEEGTYWSELEAVYLESRRLKKDLGKEIVEENKKELKENKEKKTKKTLWQKLLGK